VRNQFKSVLTEVNDLLYNEWAPIGFVGALPRDEYESYAIRIISMLAAGTNEAEIANYLATTGSSITGNPSSPQSVISVAHKLALFSESVQAIKPLTHHSSGTPNPYR